MSPPQLPRHRIFNFRRILPSQQMNTSPPQRIKIRRRDNLAAHNLFRRAVPRGNQPRRRRRIFPHRCDTTHLFNTPKVDRHQLQSAQTISQQKLWRLRHPQHQVRWFNVAVNNLTPVQLL